MAIITEKINDNLMKQYSDKGVYLLQNETGEEYRVAFDPIPCEYTYSETDKPIEVSDEIEDIEDSEVEPDESME